MLDHLIKDWLESQPLLREHFNVVIDPNLKFYSYLDTACQDSDSLGYPYHSRYMASRDIYPYRIAFIADSYVKLWRGHRIGMKKEQQFIVNDPEFFKKLANAMQLMHKVIYGKNCEFKPSNI